MERFEPLQQLSFSGEVVETVERDGRRVAGIAFKAGRVYVPLDAVPDAHLGDIVILNATVSVQKIESTYTEKTETIHPHNETVP